MPATDLRNVVLQTRDVELFAELLQARVLSLEHVRALFFLSAHEMAKKRIQRLKAAGLVVERPRRIGETSLLHLTWKGYLALRDGGHVEDDSRLSAKLFTRRMTVSAQTLAHELAVADVKVAFTTALRDDAHRSIHAFHVWPRRCSFDVTTPKGRVTVKPDGFIRIAEEKDGELAEYDFFLEVDMGTETLDRVVEKCVNYREHYQSGGYAISCGGTRDDAAAFPFRVLVTCRSEERRNNLAKRLLALNPPIRGMVLISLHRECTHSPVENIWVTPESINAGHAASQKVTIF